MSQKLPDIRAKQIGQNLNVVIGDEAFTIKGTSEQLKPTKDKIKQYTEKPTSKLLKEITEAVKPKTTQVAKEKEVAETKAVAEKKSLKRKIKEVKQENKKEVKEDKVADSKRKAILGGLLKDGTLKVNSDKYMLAGYESVPMPELLIERFVDFVLLERSIQPLINFWMLCLLNPNKIARYKLFAYLSRHKLLITPSGYFVTYRMVKTTDKPDIFTHAHNGDPRMYYEIGKVARLDRATQCDEDGSRDCSKGLHTGSPDFIGIKLGDGYNKGEIKTKSQGGGHGTGYDAPSVQQFDHSFGNQAVICLVNPMHVVSIPNSDTRKMRSAELYFAKTTTPEEVLNHLTEADYLVYDDQYATIEASELKAKLKDMKLEDYTDGSVEALSGKKDSKSKKLLTELNAKLSGLHAKVLNEPVADDVSHEEMMRVIQARTKHVSAEPKKDEKAKAAKPTKKDTSKVEEKKVEEPKAVPSKKTTASTSKTKPVDEVKEGKSKPASIPKEDVKVSPKKKDVKEEVPTLPVSKTSSKKNVAKAVGLDKDLEEANNFVKAEFEKVKKAKKSPKNFWVQRDKDGKLVKFELKKGEIPTPSIQLLGNLDDLYNKLK